MLRNRNNAPSATQAPFLGVAQKTIETSSGRWIGDEEAIDELAAHLRAIEERRASVQPEELQAALDTITDALTHHWSTGGGTRLRRFMWSLWNDWHSVNLCDLCAGLDYRLGDAILVVLRAQLVGALTEDHKRRVLRDSGEFARWEQARAETPEDEDVIYPPLPIQPDALRRLAYSAAQLAKRIEAARDEA